MFEPDDKPDFSQLPPEFQPLFAAQNAALEAERQGRIEAEAERDRLEEHIARLEHLL